MYKIKFDQPLEKGSIIKFTINNEEYQGKVILDENKYYVICDTPDTYHYEFVDKVFEPLNQTPKEYYKSIFKEESFSGCWPETPLRHLATVLIQMQKDFEKLNKPSKKKPTLNFSRFRFRIGDTIIFRKKEYKIVGYYFSEGFNNFNESYGYVIEGYPDGHKGQSFSYNEFGERLEYYSKEDRYYVNEKKAELSNKSITNQLKTIENGNEIKLSRTKTLIIRGEVPEGCRICSKVHKAAVSIKPLSHTAITGGD